MLSGKQRHQRPVADAQSVSRHALTTWLGERAKGQPQGVRLAISFYTGGRWDIAVLRGSETPKRTAVEAKALKARGFDPTAPAMTVITVDLGVLFESVLEARRGGDGRRS